MKARGQLAITAEDLKAIPYILTDYDNIRKGTSKDGRPSIIFEKRVDGTVNLVEVVAGGRKIAAKTMWKNPLRDESHRAQGKSPAPPNTSKNAISRSMFKNISDFLEKSKSSVVTDETGNLMVVYHGTSADFDAFDFDKIESEGGMFFTSSGKKAGRYGNKVVPVFMSLKNPFVTTQKEWAECSDIGPEKAKAQGYDGYIIQGLEGKATYIAFSPTQIKSAISNTGEFSDTNPNIRYSVAQPGQGAEVQPAKPNIVQRIKEFSDDIASSAERMGEKVDLRPGERIVASAEYTLVKDPAGKRMVEATERRQDNKFKLENWILDGTARPEDWKRIPPRHKIALPAVGDAILRHQKVWTLTG